jgi:hypothetical protein
MSDQRTPRDATTRTDDWDRRQMEPDSGSAEPGHTHDETSDTTARWNEAEMGEERADRTRSPRVSDEETASSAGGLSGGGKNPGGGERWAERDRR